jgi:hypothetical protein
VYALFDFTLIHKIQQTIVICGAVLLTSLAVFKLYLEPHFKEQKQKQEMNEFFSVSDNETK